MCDNKFIKQQFTKDFKDKMKQKHGIAYASSWQAHGIVDR